MKIIEIEFKMNAASPSNRFIHEHAAVRVELNDGESPEDAFALARATARRALGVDVTMDQVVEAQSTLEAARKAGLLPNVGTSRGYRSENER